MNSLNCCILCIEKATTSNWWNLLYDIVDFIGIIIGVAVGLIAIITFIGTYFFRKIKVTGWSYSSNIYTGYRFGIIIQNRCLSGLSIKQISVILDDAEEIVIFNSNQLAIQGENQNIELNPFQVKSIYSPNSTVQMFEKKSFEKYKKIMFCFTYSDEKQTKIRYKLKKAKRNQRKVFFPRQEVLRGIPVTAHMRYIIEERKESQILKQYIIFDNGLISEKIHNVPKISKECLSSESALKAFLESHADGVSFDVYYNKYYKDD